MTRRFTDAHGVEWTAEAIAKMQKVESRDPIPMITDVPWVVRFISEDPPGVRQITVGPDEGTRFGELTEDGLRELLTRASQRP